MKKIYITLLLLLTLLPFWVQAEGSCNIASWPAPELLEYISNIRKIVSNVTSEIVVLDNISWTQNKINKIESIFNSVTSWDSYFLNFRYYVKAPLSQYVIPHEIKRDYNLIENEIEWLSKYLEKIIEKWWDESPISMVKACEWVESPCNLSWNAWDIIWILIWETIKLWEDYSSSILWDNIKNWDIKFWWENFNTIMWENYYNPDSLSQCSSEWWFSERISKSISNITEVFDDWSSAMKNWDEAIWLLYWLVNEYDSDFNKEKYNSKEEELLQKELAKQWISSKSTEIMLWNLRKYNSWWWFSEDNNFIENSADTISKNLSSQLKQFADDVFTFEDAKEENREALQKTIKWLLDNKAWNNITLDIIYRTSTIYESELPFAILQDNSTQKLQWKIINMHSNLTSAINILEKVISVAEAVCNEQDSDNPC